MKLEEINEIKRQMMLLADEMEKNLYGKSREFDYLNGSIRVVKLLLKNLKYLNCEYDMRIVLDFCQELMRRIGEEQYSGVKETYFNFDCMGET